MEYKKNEVFSMEISNTKHSFPESSSSSTSMSGYYYCCHCGDGPHNTTYNPTCPNCFRSQSNAYQAINPGYYAYAPDTHGATSYANTDIHTMGAPYSSDASSATAYLAGNNAPFGNVYSGPHNHGPKQPPKQEWQCCQCAGVGGSVALDEGCATCAKHWRCSRCKVYNV